MPPPPSSSSLVGPLAGWELVRLARRGQAHRSRLLLLYILTLSFAGYAYFRFTSPGQTAPPADLISGGTILSPHESATFGSNLALVVLLAQLAVVAVITPAYAAAAVAEEKERKTLPLLLTTGLTDGEIVFGKAAGRAGFVLAAVFAGTPVLMIARLFGGIDLGFVACGCLLIAGTAVLTAAIGVHTACRAPDLRSAVIRSYGLTLVLVCGVFLPPMVLISPFGVLVLLRDPDAPVPVVLAAAYAVLQSVTGVCMLVSAARSLRDEDDPPPLTTAFPLPPRPAESPRPAPDPVVLPRLDPRRPVLWKERCLLARRDAGRWAIAVIIGSVAVLLVVCGAVQLVSRERERLDPAGAARLARSHPEPPDGGGWLLVSGGVLALGVYLVPLALGAAGMIARERERQTLDPLLAVPLGRREILLAKLRAHAAWAWPLGAAAVPAVGVGFGADGGPWLGVAAGGAVLTGVGFVVGLGAWLSVRCPGELRAFRLLLPAVVVVVGLPVAVHHGIDWGRVRPWAAGLGAVAAALGVAGILLWRRAVRDLERGG